MTDETTPVTTGGEAQPIADANSIDSIVDATIEKPATTETEGESETAEKPEDPWPKKAENALAKAKGRAAQLRAERDQERAARLRLEQQLAQTTAPKKTENTGEPKETDYQNYHDYIRAVNKYDMQQELAGRDTKTQETQKNDQYTAWENKRLEAVDKQAEEFTKEVPEIETIFEENIDTIKAYPPHVKQLFLESDNAPLALYNLEKEGKLEALGSMSLAKAALEISRASSKAIEKPKTKAPTPLPASRGSVPSGKSPDDMNGKEIRAWMRPD